MFSFLVKKCGYTYLTYFDTAYPPPPTSYAAADTHKGPYVMAPPPMGYPTKDGNQQGHAPVETRTKGDGFLKGW